MELHTSVVHGHAKRAARLSFLLGNRNDAVEFDLPWEEHVYPGRVASDAYNQLSSGRIDVVTDTQRQVNVDHAIGVDCYVV